MPTGFGSRPTASDPRCLPRRTLVSHLGFLLSDAFLLFAPLDLIVPMRSTYRPVGIALGIASMFLLLLGVFATSWGRKLIGTKWWRRMHSLSVPAFTLALLHGLAAGTDARRVVMFSMYAATAAIVFFLLIVRALTVTARRMREAATPASVATPPRLHPVPSLIEEESGRAVESQTG